MAVFSVVFSVLDHSEVNRKTSLAEFRQIRAGDSFAYFSLNGPASNIGKNFVAILFEICSNIAFLRNSTCA